jgi:diphosphomevalonate decarboxylase
MKSKMSFSATAVACANIAFIKYWGNANQELAIPSNGSLSMNLAGLETITRVKFSQVLTADELILNGTKIIGERLDRVSKMLSRVRQMAELNGYAQVVSENNFPTGTGIASSASAFAALALAASAAAGLNLNEPDLSKLARTGSGSACRSIPSGFVEWCQGDSHSTSFAHSIAPPDHWELIDHVVVVSVEHKMTGSLSGHAIADTSPLQTARLENVSRRLDICRQAILNKDFSSFAKVVELDSNIMHAVMITSTPPLLYWRPETITIMRAVQALRQDGLNVCYTIDAGPNVHVITTQEDCQQIKEALKSIPGIQNILTAKVGGPAKLLDTNLTKL